jgi:nitrogen fixation NifU-like protein
MDETSAELQEMTGEGGTRQTYTEKVIDHAVNPRSMGRPERADGRARFTGPCGDTMEIWIEVKEGVLKRARFESDGCLATIACGSMVTELAGDKPLLEALEIGQTDVLEALDGLPTDSEHCALLAVTTLKLAISDCLAKMEAPWKKVYERPWNA